MFLVELPPYILMVFLDCWVPILDLVVINTALCNHSKRDKFKKVAEVCLVKSLYGRASLRLSLPLLNKEQFFSHVLYVDKEANYVAGLYKRLEDAMKGGEPDCTHLSCISNSTTIREFCAPVNYLETDLLKTFIFWDNSFCIQKVLELETDNETYYSGQVSKKGIIFEYNGEGRLVTENRVVFAVSTKTKIKSKVVSKGRKNHKQHLYTYKGQFQCNKKCGKGVLSFSNGMVYSGTWESDRLQGKCLIRYTNGDEIYGEFDKGRLVYP